VSGDIVERLRQAHQTVPIPSIASLYSNAADAIEQRDAELAAERAEVERLRAAVDVFVAEVDAVHYKHVLYPLCNWCEASDGSWPCVHRMALDDLQEARRER
jgi:hypothetical protein